MTENLANPPLTADFNQSLRFFSLHFTLSIPPFLSLPLSFEVKRKLAGKVRVTVLEWLELCAMAFCFYQVSPNGHGLRSQAQPADNL